MKEARTCVIYSPNEEFHRKIRTGDAGRYVLLCGDPARCGTDTFIRIGTAGGMAADVRSREVVIGNAATRTRHVRVGSVVQILADQTRRAMSVEGHVTNEV